MLFELIAARYEQRSLLITANQPFGEWGRIFPDQAMTLPGIDRLVHHATILEINVQSYRRKPPSTASADQDGRQLTQLPSNSKRPPMIDALRQSNLTLSVNHLANAAGRHNHLANRPPLLILIHAWDD